MRKTNQIFIMSLLLSIALDIMISGVLAFIETHDNILAGFLIGLGSASFSRILLEWISKWR